MKNCKAFPTTAGNSPHKMDGSYPKRVADSVEYRKKNMEFKKTLTPFLAKFGEEITSKEVIREIDGNRRKLKQIRNDKRKPQKLLFK